MKSIKSPKDARFDMRISEEQKEMYKKAAEISGFKTISSFIKASVNEKARNIIDNYEKILISEKDKKLFFEAIFSDKEPNDKLKRALKTHKKLIKQE